MNFRGDASDGTVIEQAISLSRPIEAYMNVDDDTAL